jgi:Zn-finger nucleic acid-binding protein
MELLLAVWSVAMVVGGATVAGVRFSNDRHQKRWHEALAASDTWTTKLDADGWISASRYHRGRDAVVRVLPSRGGSIARLDVHLYDLGLDESVTVGLTGDAPRAANAASGEAAEKLAASDVVRSAARSLLTSHWTLDRMEITEDMLVVEGVERVVPEHRRLERVAKMFELLEQLGGAVVDVLDLPEPGQRCPLCEGAELVPAVGHLMEAVCRNCHGRLLSPGAVQRLFGEELGMGPGDLKAGLSDARGLTCPSCTSKMGPLLLGDKILDLCPGCGSMWLDKGELQSVSGGRYDEILGPIGDDA